METKNNMTRAEALEILRQARKVGVATAGNRSVVYVRKVRHGKPAGGDYTVKVNGFIACFKSGMSTAVSILCGPN